MRFTRPFMIGGLAATALAVPAAAFAHFILHLPVPTLEQNRLGDPQKKFPCGGTTADPGKPTGAVATVRGGDELPIKITETIFHPGHYRVALAVNDIAELPKDPETVTRDTPRGPYSVSAKIDANPAPPVITDGLFVHTTRPPAPPAGTPATPLTWETKIKMPNINCEACTLQVIQWMAEHGLNADGDFTYHHCATVKITANPALPIDRRWPGQAAPARGGRGR